MKKIFFSFFKLDLRSLALFRVLLGLLVLWDIVSRIPDMSRDYTEFLFTDDSILSSENASFFYVAKNFIPYFITGTTVEAGFFFAMTCVLALMMVAGFKSRLAAFGCWILIYSLQLRNPFVLNNGDGLFRILLLFAIFFPTGQHFSLDSLRKKKASTNHSFSLAAAGFTLQIVLMYWLSVIFKISGDSNLLWLRQGSAVYYTLSIDMLAAYPVGTFLLSLPYWILKLLNYAVLLTEIFCPLLLLLPYKNGLFRFAGVLTLFMLHIGFGSGLRLGLWPFVSAIALVPFIPGMVWDRLLNNAKQPIISGGGSAVDLRFSNLFMSLCIASIVMSNFASFNLTSGYFKPLMLFSKAIGLGQSWKLFSPPTKEGGWHIVKGELGRGDQIDLLRNGQPLSYEKPFSPSALYKTSRFRRLMMANTIAPKEPHILKGLSRDFCDDWNDGTIDAQDKLRKVQIIYMLEPTLPYGNVSAHTPKILSEYDC